MNLKTDTLSNYQSINHYSMQSLILTEVEKRDHMNRYFWLFYLAINIGDKALEWFSILNEVIS